MYEVLMEILEPQIQLREKAVLKRCIQKAVDMLRDYGCRDEEILPAIIKEFALSPDEAEDYLKSNVQPDSQ